MEIWPGAPFSEFQKNPKIGLFIILKNKINPPEITSSMAFKFF
jgi:hypothetical protein